MSNFVDYCEECGKLADSCTCQCEECGLSSHKCHCREDEETVLEILSRWQSEELRSM